MSRRVHALLPHKIEIKFHFHFHGQTASDAVGPAENDRLQEEKCTFVRRHVRTATFRARNSDKIDNRNFSRRRSRIPRDRKNGSAVFYRRKIRRISRIHSRYRTRKGKAGSSHARRFPMMQIADLSRGIRRDRILEPEVNRRRYMTPVNAMGHQLIATSRESKIALD